jgi:hypothetical protein
MLGAENLSLALQQQFYAPVQFKMAGNAVEEAVLAFFDFLKEPVKPLKNISIFRLPPSIVVGMWAINIAMQMIMCIMTVKNFFIFTQRFLSTIRIF